jgi:predicted nucleic acid-binding protein
VRAIILDNEAVQALSHPDHAKHRVVVAHLAAAVARRRRGAMVRTVVPTAVRVEAGWDRSARGAAAINRFRVVDAVLDSSIANAGAAIIRRTGVSVADAHVGAAAQSLIADDVVVLTSDPEDMVRVSAPTAVVAIRI